MLKPARTAIEEEEEEEIEGEQVAEGGDAPVEGSEKAETPAAE